jgi:dipeptide/tripeptide permease
MSNVTKSSGHPTGLWVLFTTELWERFAFYAMRAILVLYLIAEADKQGNPGFGWSEADAYMLYGWYTSLVYVAPLLGGWLADSFIGQRRAVIIGAVLMAIGEFFLFATELVRIGDGTPITMATDATAFWTFYAGLGLMILGNGFFKPCISVMVGQLYEPGDRRRDSGFTIFYMGINIGAALSPIVAGLLAAKFGFQWGFFCAGIGMCIGLTIQLIFSPIFLKGIGTLPKQHKEGEELTPKEKEKREQKIYEQNRPLVRQDWDRMFVIVVLSLFVIAFWLTFEQAGSSLNVFAEKSTDRIVPNVICVPITFQTKEKTGSFMESVLPFLYFEDKTEEAKKFEQNAVDTEKILEELKKLYAAGFKEDKTGISLHLSALLQNEDKVVHDYIIGEVSIESDTDLAKKVKSLVERTEKQIKEYKDKAEEAKKESEPHPVNLLFTESKEYLKEKAKNSEERAKNAEEEAVNAEAVAKKAAELLNTVQKYSEENQNEESKRTLARFQKLEAEYREKAEKARKFATDASEQAKVVRGGDYIFPAAWYQSVNAICIVIFAPFFTLMWNFLHRRGIEPSTPVKFALGILLVSVSFLVMIPGAIQAAHTGGSAAAYWLLACYLFATWGELCLSPVGLSMISKLSPARYASMFMGVWFLASATAYWLAGYCAAVFAAGEGITILFGKDGGLADFFLLLAIVPAIVGFIALALAPMRKKKMHGRH